ncbi:hypothetical protein BAB79_15040 [Mycobacteroides abscessus]|nr:hypothetical protein A3O06_15045 [Mycobacteroides abscessus]ANO24729.1 hypothetical protein BAB79_15040 [Mycobacteroides abscessus]
MLRSTNSRSAAVEMSPATPKFIERHDLVVSKLTAWHEKDIEFAASLLDPNLVEIDVLLRAQPPCLPVKCG